MANSSEFALEPLMRRCDVAQLLVDEKLAANLGTAWCWLDAVDTLLPKHPEYGKATKQMWLDWLDSVVTP